MKCERFLEKHETGSPWERLGARLHLRRCPRCQLVYRRLVEFKREMSRIEALPETVRDRWLAAAETGIERVPVPVRPLGRWVPVGLAAALLGMAALAVWLATHPTPGTPVGEELSGELARSELAGLRDGLGELSRELDQLASQVSLLDEAEEVDLLLASYAIERRSNR